MAKRDSVELTVFLMGDGVTAAIAGPALLETNGLALQAPGEPTLLHPGPGPVGRVPNSAFTPVAQPGTGSLLLHIVSLGVARDCGRNDLWGTEPEARSSA
jgi:hypothetical protein